MRSKNPIDEEGPEETEINKTGEITTLWFTVIEVMVTPENIYTDQTGCFPITSRKGTNICLCYIVMATIQ